MTPVNSVEPVRGDPVTKRTSDLPRVLLEKRGFPMPADTGPFQEKGEWAALGVDVALGVLIIAAAAFLLAKAISLGTITIVGFLGWATYVSLYGYLIWTEG